MPVAVFGMVPFLTSVLSTMLPMLGMAKHDTMRVVFCCGKLEPPGQVGSSEGRGCVLPVLSLAFYLQGPFVGDCGCLRQQEEGRTVRGRVDVFSLCLCLCLIL